MTFFHPGNNSRSSILIGFLISSCLIGTLASSGARQSDGVPPVLSRVDAHDEKVSEGDGSAITPGSPIGPMAELAETTTYVEGILRGKKHGLGYAFWQRRNIFNLPADGYYNANIGVSNQDAIIRDVLTQLHRVGKLPADTTYLAHGHFKIVLVSASEKRVFRITMGCSAIKHEREIRYPFLTAKDTEGKDTALSELIVSSEHAIKFEHTNSFKQKQDTDSGDYSKALPVWRVVQRTATVLVDIVPRGGDIADEKIGAAMKDLQGKLNNLGLKIHVDDLNEDNVKSFGEDNLIVDAGELKPTKPSSYDPIGYNDVEDLRKVVFPETFWLGGEELDLIGSECLYE